MRGLGSLFGIPQPSYEGLGSFGPQRPPLGLALPPGTKLDREMSYDGSHPRQQEQAARDYFRSYGPELLKDALIPGYGAGGDAKAASEAYGEGRYGAAALNAGMAAADFLPFLGALPAAAKGIRAFHGSPHDFDRFDMSKIGTGEGAQAYGHGLYFAESEGVAKSYRDTLSRGKSAGINSAATLGQPRDIATARVAVNARLAEGATPAEAIAQTVRGNLEKAQYYEALAKRMPPEDAADYLRWAADLKMQNSIIEQLGEGAFNYNPGRMYEVNINADPEAFLDWDKPLSEQPRVAERLGMATRSEDDINKEAYDLMTGWVAKDGDARWMDDPQRRAIIDKLQNELDNIAPPVTGESFYRSGGQGGAADLAAMMGGRDVSAASAKRLRDAGIPGIKYLDAGSRGAGDGSRNYVVFDDRLITILRKYGIGALMAGGAGYGLTQAEYAQAAELLAQDGMNTGAQ